MNIKHPWDNRSVTGELCNLAAEAATKKKSRFWDKSVKHQPIAYQVAAKNAICIKQKLYLEMLYGPASAKVGSRN